MVGRIKESDKPSIVMIYVLLLLRSRTTGQTRWPTQYRYFWSNGYFTFADQSWQRVNPSRLLGLGWERCRDCSEEDTNGLYMYVYIYTHIYIYIVFVFVFRLYILALAPSSLLAHITITITSYYYYRSTVWQRPGTTAPPLFCAWVCLFAVVGGMLCKSDKLLNSISHLLTRG